MRSAGRSSGRLSQDEMTVHLKDGRYTDAVVHGIDKAGELLAAHFPRAKGEAGGEGQLPNAVERD